MSVLNQDLNLEQRHQLADFSERRCQTSKLLNLNYKPTAKEVKNVAKKHHGHEFSICQANHVIEVLQQLDSFQQEKDYEKIDTYIQAL